MSPLFQSSVMQRKSASERMSRKMTWLEKVFRCTRWSPANLDLSRRMGCLRIGANVTNVVFLTPRDYMKNTKIAVLCGVGASVCESGPQSLIMKIQLSRPVARV
ncbi:hypothetical protein SuNHUV7_27000 (plasmid) [Pseudoseohaeicola sp. NH-UV-7]|jgi:hypothetical protein